MTQSREKEWNFIFLSGSIWYIMIVFFYFLFNNHAVNSTVYPIIKSKILISWLLNVAFITDCGFLSLSIWPWHLVEYNSFIHYTNIKMCRNCEIRLFMRNKTTSLPINNIQKINNNSSRCILSHAIVGIQIIYKQNFCFE